MPGLEGSGVDEVMFTLDIGIDISTMECMRHIGVISVELVALKSLRTLCLA